MTNVLGAIVSGRLVQTDFSLVGESQFLTTITDVDSINHIVIFLTGAIPLPEGTVGMVYFSWPDPNAPPNWQLLGHISNSKPSAIFKISSLKKLSEMTSNGYVGTFGQQKICNNAQIGISIEPEINAQLQLPTTTVTANCYVSFSQKMLENFINFVASFAITQHEMQPTPGVSFVPLNTVQTWYQNFERRLQQNPNFWKS
ncbi:protein OPI10 homolog isoform X2 [Arctopsyche grandis]|uniref:protein OPI10 homolog isoform X2 n=1 Tax=Arctopsyche grandis TaxID=121162 RepID=UPI00406D66B7